MIKTNSAIHHVSCVGANSVRPISANRIAKWYCYKIRRDSCGKQQISHFHLSRTELFTAL